MQSKQRNQQFKGNGLQGTLLSNSAIWSGSPVVSAAVQVHTDNMDEINTWQLAQQVSKTIAGLSRNKEILRQLIIIQLIKFIGCIKAYGSETGQWTIVAAVNYTQAQLENMAATDFHTAADNVHQTANTLGAVLVPYGIPLASIPLLLSDIQNFDSAYSSIKQAHADSKTATANLAIACKKMMSHLKLTLDNHMKQYIGLPFYQTYFNSRKIYNYTTDTAGIRGRITDASNAEVIKHGLLELVLTGRSEPITINNKGEYHRKKVELTNCTLRIRVPHYLSAEFDVTLKKNTTTVFDIQMTPEPVAQVPSSSNSNNSVAAQ